MTYIFKYRLSTRFPMTEYEIPIYPYTLYMYIGEKPLEAVFSIQASTRVRLKASVREKASTHERQACVRRD